MSIKNADVDCIFEGGANDMINSRLLLILGEGNEVFSAMFHMREQHVDIVIPSSIVDPRAQP